MLEATITKKIDLETAVDATNSIVVSTGGDAPWSPISSAAAMTGGKCAKSGAIADDQESWILFTVSGAGTLTFWTKVSCEEDDSGFCEFDHVSVYVDGVEDAFYRLDSEHDWTQQSVTFASPGNHTVKIAYDKDESDDGGEDCAWIDGVEWIPKSSDAIQPLADNAAPEAVTNAIELAGFADADGVKAAIGGSAAEYAAFKSWAGSVKNPSGAPSPMAVAGESAVVANTNAAAAYLLGAERLFENAPKVEFEELAVGDNGTSGTEGTVTIAVTVKDGEDSVECSAEKVKSLFEATGNLGDWAGDAKLPVEVEVIGTSPMRFRVTPGDGTSPSAFLRIRP